MLLKLLAPMRTDFAIVTEQPLLQAQKYANFWDTVSDDIQDIRPHLLNPDKWSAELHELRFAHRTIHHAMLTDGSKYRALAEDSLTRPLHVLEIHLPPSLIDLSPQEPDAEILLTHLRRVILRVYDHHITLVEVDCDLKDQLQQIHEDAVESYLEQLQDTAITLGETLCHWCRDNVLDPLFVWIKQRAHAQKYIDMTPSSIIGEQVMWVTRTLIFESDNASNRDAIIHHWLLDAGGTEVVAGKSQIEEVQTRPDAYLAIWLKYLFREQSYSKRPPEPASVDALTYPFSDAWKAMIHAQYYYAALDVVDSHLTTILASAWVSDSDVKIDTLKGLLEYNIRKANLLLLQQQDNNKYYRRTVKNALDTVLRYWQFEYVLVEPVQNKTALCESRLQLLLQQEAAKSAIFTDMILLGIGITGIFSTFLGLAEFGRTMATDVSLASYDINSPNLIEWLAVQPTDVILVLSVIISLVLAILYLFFRQRQTVS